MELPSRKLIPKNATKISDGKDKMENDFSVCSTSSEI